MNLQPDLYVDRTGCFDLVAGVGFAPAVQRFARSSGNRSTGSISVLPHPSGYEPDEVKTLRN